MELISKPNESDCCNSGCNPCILDVYEEQLKKYNKRENEKNELYHNCLLPMVYTVFKITNIQKSYKDALLLTFEYVKFMNNVTPNKELKVMFNPGQFIMLKAGRKNDEFQRPYTPIPIKKDGKLSFTILIKLYEFGRMCNYIKRLKLDSKTLWRGPYGDFVINYTYKNILFIAQGVGIAPFYSILTDILENEDCYTFLKLYYCCKDIDTIYLRNELNDLQKNWNFTCEIFLSNFENSMPKYNEIIHSSRLNDAFVENHIREKIHNIQVLICGSEHFMTHFKNVAMDCKVDEKNIITF